MVLLQRAAGDSDVSPFATSQADKLVCLTTMRLCTHFSGYIARHGPLCSGLRPPLALPCLSALYRNGIGRIWPFRSRLPQMTDRSYSGSLLILGIVHVCADMQSSSLGVHQKVRPSSCQLPSLPLKDISFVDHPRDF